MITYNIGHLAQWLARYTHIVEVAGSNPAVPTKEG